MQRVTRYPLLLRQVLNYTRPDQDAAALEVALAIAQDMVTRINERVREAEAADRLRVLSDQLWVGGEGRIDLTAPTAYQGPRRLIKEGPVAKAKSGRRLQMVLCNDIVLLIEDERLYRMVSHGKSPRGRVSSADAQPISLFDLSIATGPEMTFALIPGSPKNTVRLKAPSTSAKAEWVDLLNRARKDAIAARRTSALSDSGRSAFDGQRALPTPAPRRERSGSYSSFATSLSMGDRNAPGAGYAASYASSYAPSSYSDRTAGFGARRASAGPGPGVGGPDKRLSVMSGSSQRSGRSASGAGAGASPRPPSLPTSPRPTHALPPGAAEPAFPQSPPLPPRHTRHSSTGSSSNFDPLPGGPPAAPVPTGGHPGGIPAGYSDAELERYARQYDDMLGPAAGGQVYDDAHSYAGQGRSMYEHEF